MIAFEGMGQVVVKEGMHQARLMSPALCSVVTYVTLGNSLGVSDSDCSFDNDKLTPFPKAYQSNCLWFGHIQVICAIWKGGSGRVITFLKITLSLVTPGILAI